MTKIPEIKDSPVQMHYSSDGHVQLGPCYSVQLPDALPVGTGWSQACPDRSELVACRRKYERVAASYEVALGHMFQTADVVRMQAKEIERLNARTAELESQLRFYVGIAVNEAQNELPKYQIMFEEDPKHEGLYRKVIKPVEVASTGDESKTSRD